MIRSNISRPKYRVPEQKLSETLSAHKTWLSSKGKQGAKAIFNSVDFGKYTRTRLDGKPGGGVPLQGAILRECVINECNLLGAYLQGASLEGSQIDKSTFWYARIKSAHLDGVKIKDTSLNNSYLRKTSINRSHLESVTLINASCDRSQFNLSHISDANFTSALLNGSEFRECRIYKSLFENAKISGGNFEKSEIVETSFNGSFLSGASFKEAIIDNTRFSEAILFNGDFSNSELKDINFTNTRLDGANFTNANFTNVSMSGANLTNIVIDHKTVQNLPKELVDEYGHSFIIKGLVEEVNNLNSIRKSIHFSPEHRQAGIGILSYFSKVLDKAYPNNDIRFRIEQDKEVVSLVIETPEGDLIERIEKTLMQYGDVISGAIPVSSITNNELLILDIKTELRIAKLRIENQTELLSIKDKEINRLFESITRSLDGSNVSLCLSQNLTNGSSKMRDSYNAGQAGAQGPNAQAHNNHFNQIWQKKHSEFDFAILSEELDILINHLKKEANSSEQFSEISLIAGAKKEAQNGDGPKVLENLSKVGKWVVDTATKIGVSVVTEAIKSTGGI